MNNTNNKIDRILENKNPKHVDYKYNNSEITKESKDNHTYTSKFSTEDYNVFQTPQSKKDIIFKQLLNKIKIEEIK